jgi:hypothetical protein
MAGHYLLITPLPTSLQTARLIFMCWSTNFKYSHLEGAFQFNSRQENHRPEAFDEMSQLARGDDALSVQLAGVLSPAYRHTFVWL